MANGNSVTLVGNLTDEPELRYTPSGAPVVNFRIAVNRSWTDKAGERQEQTDFFSIVAWRQLGENVAESLHKGSRVLVTGRLQSRSWETEDGSRRSVVEVQADEIGASLRFATAEVTKTTRSQPASGEWGESAGQTPPTSSDRDSVEVATS